jgi:hypothetical protein
LQWMWQVLFGSITPELHHNCRILSGASFRQSRRHELETHTRRWP